MQFCVFANLLLLMYRLFKCFNSSMHAVMSSTQYVSSSVLNAAGISKLFISIDWLVGNLVEISFMKRTKAETFKKCFSPKFHRSYHQCPLLDSALSETNPVNIFKIYLLRYLLLLYVQLSTFIPRGRWSKYLNVDISQILQNCLFRR
jgi:hypothetical protein